MDKRKKSRKLGGYRPGAGRKRGRPDLGRTTSLVLQPELLAWLDARAAALGLSRSQTVAEILERARPSVEPA